MARDRRPPGSRSPFENIGRSSGKRERENFDVTFETEAVTNAVDPARSKWPPKTSKEIMLDMKKAVREMVGNPFSGEFTVHVGKDQYAGIGRVEMPGRVRSKAVEDEQRLRGPVAKYLLTATPGVAWDDVVGNDTARAHLVEAIEHPVRHAELYRHYGEKPTKGVLLYGPPGCGKTMFGKAAASVLAQLHGAKAASFMSIKAPELQSGWVGETERTIRDIFAYARAYKALHGHPLVVFIDEADAILPSREGRATWFQASNVATFLTEMDGIEDSGALVILATNRPEAIDAAILRDGRIDRKIRVERPDHKAAAAILGRALAGIPVAHQDDQVGHGATAMRGALADQAARSVFAPEQIVAQLATDQGPAFVRLSDIVNGAMLVGLVEQAKGNAFRRDLAAGGAPTGLTREDLDQAVMSVIAQNRGLNHACVIQEIAAREGFSMARVIPDDARPPRYALDEAGRVVRVQ